MAKCKLCKTNIPDGTEYCKSCQDKEILMSNESYLDSLLNSVKNTVPSVEGVYKKKNSSDTNSQERFLDNSKVVESQDDEIYQVDLGDIDDFEQFDLDDDLMDINNDFVIGDKELFGEDLSDILTDDVKSMEEPKETNITSKVAVQQELYQSANDNKKPADDFEDSVNQNSKDEDDYNEAMNGFNEPMKEFNEPIDDFNGTIDGHNEPMDVSPIISTENSMNTLEENPTEIAGNNISQNEITDFYGDVDSDQELNDLLNSLDDMHLNDKAGEEIKTADNDQFSAPKERNADIQNDLDLLLDDGIKPIGVDELEMVDAEEDDFLSLLNQISSDDPVVEDVRAINDILNGGVVEPPKKPEKPSDVGEVFSDALKVVSSLNDHDLNELDLLGPPPEKNKKKQKKSKKNKEEESPEKTEVKPKKGLFKRLFGNVEDEKTKKKNQSNLKNSSTAGEEKKKDKSKKGKKGNATKDAEADDTLENGKPGKEKAAKGNAADKKSEKKDKKEKKKKTKEVIQVIDEIEEDEGRINRLGASIVFIFFGLLVLLLIAGTNVISYTISIQNATKYFNNQKYTEAYEEVYGEKIKDEDIELYSKIQTVMFVNKQLNSYNNYYSIGEYPEALDSLLKGLKRYDKYIEFATILGIESDLNYVRTQILAELENVFDLSEKEALKLIDKDNMKEYSLEVYEVASEKMNNQN